MSVPRDEVRLCRIPCNSRLPVHRCPSPGLVLQSAQEGALSMGGACGSRGRGLGALSQSKAPLIRGGAAPPPWPAAAGTRWHAGPGPRRRPQVLARGSGGEGRVGVSNSEYLGYAARDEAGDDVATGSGSGTQKSGCACLPPSPVKEDCEWETLSPRSPCTMVDVVQAVT